MPSYKVKRDLPQNGRTFRKGRKIELTERQARHLLINGFIEPVKDEEKPKTATKAASRKAGQQGKGE